MTLNALRFAPVNGHVRCLRLLMDDFLPNYLFNSIHIQADDNTSDAAKCGNKLDRGMSVFCLLVFFL